tara:strand:+ start:881 stop:2596 length:1716 start_codon:yes stop_codon:yes gene_type:complete
MKIPTISTVDKGLTRKTGAQPMNVRLSGDAMAAPGRAVAQLGQTVTNAGLNWLDKELKMRRATEVAAAKKHITKKAEEAAFSLRAVPDATKANALFQSMMKKEMQLINAGGVDGLTLSDRVAKRSFGAESATIISNTGLKLRQGARKLQAAEFVSTTLRNADNIVDRLSSATNPMDRKTLTGELTKSFQLLKNIGHIDAKQQYKYEKQYLNRADVLQVEKNLNFAVQTKNEDAALQVLQNIQDRKKYPHLTAQSRQDLVERATGIVNSIERTNNSDEVRTQANNKRIRIEKENSTFAETASAINKMNLANSQPATADNAEATPQINVQQVNDLLADNEIRFEQHQRLIALLNQSGNPAVTDGLYLNAIRKEMRAVANDDAGDKRKRLNDIAAKAAKQIGLKISQDDYLRVENRIPQLLAQTPEARQANIYSKVIAQFADANDILSKILPGAKQKAALIEAQFEAMVEDGMLPREAFNIAITSLVENEKVNLRQIPKFLNGTNKKPFEQWTIEDVDAQVTETNTKFKGKASTWAFERLKIKMLRMYIENKSKGEAAAKNVESEVNEYFKVNP